MQLDQLITRENDARLVRYTLSGPPDPATQADGLLLHDASLEPSVSHPVIAGALMRVPDGEDGGRVQVVLAETDRQFRLNADDGVTIVLRGPAPDAVDPASRDRARLLLFEHLARVPPSLDELQPPADPAARIAEIRARAENREYHARTHWALFDADDDVLFLLQRIAELEGARTSIGDRLIPPPREPGATR